MHDDVVIGGCTVPPRLIELIRAEKWVPPSDEILLEVFGERPVQPYFYGEAMLIRENRAWQARAIDHESFSGADDTAAFTAVSQKTDSM
jgi:hypothetical protein